MLVYGDPQMQVSATAQLDRLRGQIAKADVASFENLRAILIQIGQFEQGVADSKLCCREIQQVMALTDALAEAFAHAFNGLAPSRETMMHIAQALQFAFSKHETINLKVPEGFAFYALFPEQYVMAATDWALAHEGDSIHRALVIGIRSIGTTLSAVVAAILRAKGWSVERVTVRPSGNPYRREVAVSPLLSCDVQQALIVDEGPGASGSSMAAVAEQLHRDGMSYQQIAFLPGHAGDPGPAATDSVRDVWKNVPRHFTALNVIRWQGCSLQQVLERETSRILREPCHITTRDISAGAWREVAFLDKADWPAVAVQFERMKFLCAAKNGRKLLWKFEGIGRSECGVSPDTVCHGFRAEPWIEGRRLRSADARPALLDLIADYVLHSAGPPLDHTDAVAALQRLRDMLVLNTRETLGEPATAFVAALGRKMIPATTVRRYGDGRMAPWEWIDTGNAGIHKTDRGGHDYDHTFVGVQPVYWDIAGVLIEWNLDGRAAEQFLDALRKRGLEIAPESLRFYAAAYAAFRAGICHLASASAVAEEAFRLVAQRDVFLRALRSIAEPDP